MNTTLHYTYLLSIRISLSATPYSQVRPMSLTTRYTLTIISASKTFNFIHTLKKLRIKLSQKPSDVPSEITSFLIVKLLPLPRNSSSSLQCSLKKKHSKQFTVL